MGCEDVKRVIYFFLDGALGEKKRRFVDEHLRECPDCHTRTRIQQRLRQFIRRRLSRIPAPERLRIRVRRTLRAFGD